MNTHFNLPQGNDRFNNLKFGKTISYHFLIFIPNINHELITNKKCCIHGPSGIGKSYMALSVAHFGDYLAIRLDCESPFKINMSIQSFARFLNLNVTSLNTSGYLIDAIKAKLIQNKEQRYLFILDNVNEYEDVKTLATEILSQSIDFYIIITTRNPNLSSDFKNF